MCIILDKIWYLPGGDNSGGDVGQIQVITINLKQDKKQDKKLDNTNLEILQIQTLKEN
jgi:hypothetical protein